jgi:ligand-binding sensor domain-containing protein
MFVPYKCFIIFLMLAVTASGQPNCKIEYYSTEHGLSHQRVTTMLKDREGFMWFGTWDGINRFDGQKFVSYKSSPGDRSQLGNDRIDQIVEDQSGYFWIRAYDRQVYQFNKKTDQFLPLSTIVHLNGNKNITFSKILHASNGWVWLQSVEEGIFCIPQQRLPGNRFTQYKEGLAADYRLPSGKINFFHEDNNHQVWVGTPNGLCHLQVTNGVYINSKNVPPDLSAGTNITSFDEDQNNMYFGSADGNVTIYDKKSKSFSVRKITGHLNALLRSTKREVIYATTSTGELVTLNLKDQKFTKVTYHTAESLHSLYEDGNGCLWIEPEKSGAIRFDPIKKSFQYFSQANKEGLNIIGNRFRVLEDNNGVVWVNMKGGGFGYYN